MRNDFAVFILTHGRADNVVTVPAIKKAGYTGKIYFIMYCCHKPYQIIGHIMDEDILAKKMAAVTDMSMCDIPCRMTAPNLEVKKMEQARKDACFI